jgi:RNA polymerase sigma-70 factor (ECF subfamily)
MAEPLPDARTELLLRAKAGDLVARGVLLERYRGYLMLLAHVYLSPKIRVKADLDDVVQDAFLQAHEKFDQFAGTTLPEFQGWMREILASRLEKVVRRYETAKRDIRLEIRLSLDASSRHLEKLLPAHDAKTPGTRVGDDEELAILAHALIRLPVDYRTVLVGRHIEGLSFPEIGERMGRSAGAVRQLWVRGVQRLRELVENPS